MTTSTQERGVLAKGLLVSYGTSCFLWHILFLMARPVLSAEAEMPKEGGREGEDKDTERERERERERE